MHFNLDECKKITRGDALLFKEFDSKYNVDTESPLILSGDGSGQLKPGSEYGDNGVTLDWNEYMPAGLPWLSLINEYLLENVPNLQDFTFTDIGAGKGRVILYNIINNSPYKKYVGIENDKKFYDIFINNLKNTTININKEVEVLFQNAMDLDYSSSNNIYFLFYPFQKHYFDIFMEKHLNSMRNKNNYFAFVFEADYEASKILGDPVFFENAVTIYKV